MEGTGGRFQAVYQKKQTKAITFGLVIAFMGAMFNCVFQNFNVAATSLIEGGIGTTLLAAYIMSVLTLGICEIGGGIITIIYNVCRGIPLAEVTRTWSVNSGKTIMISSIVAGPIGTAASVMSIALIGSTYANCIIGLAPVVTAFLGIFILKERINGRVWIGIILSVAGATIACMGTPEGVNNLALGIIIALVAPVAFALEGIISAHAVDVTDPATACPLFRMIMSGIFEIVIALVIAAVTGHMAWIGTIIGLITSTPMCMVWMLCTMIAMFIQYNTAYASFNYCGAVKSEAILWTGTFWTIPVGFIMGGLGIIEYSITGIGVVGAICVVIGIILVVAKPSELFSLRNN